MSSIESFAKYKLQALPQDELWRLFIDGFRQEEGKYAFDKGIMAEGGYYASMEMAWKKMVKEIDKPLTVDYLVKIHEAAVGKLKEDGRNLKVLRGPNDTPESFGLIAKKDDLDNPDWNCTKEGIREFLEFVRENKEQLSLDGQEYALNVIVNNRPFPVEYNIYRNDRTLEEIVDELYAAAKEAKLQFNARGDARVGATKILADYNANIATAKTEKEKLYAIVDCVARLERLHSFQDANCRTMILVLNKLLMQNKLSPTILENPNRMDALSKAELIREIKIGQQHFKQQCIDDAGMILTKNIITLENKETLKEQLKMALSKDPLQAMSQLNALYNKLTNNQMEIRAAGGTTGRKTMTMTQNMKGASKEKAIWKIALQKLYSENFSVICKKIDLLNGNIEQYQRAYDKAKEDKMRLVDESYSLIDELQELRYQNRILTKKLELILKEEFPIEEQLKERDDLQQKINANILEKTLKDKEFEKLKVSQSNQDEEFLKCEQLNDRTPKKVEWMMQRLGEFANEHRKIIDHQTKKGLSSSLRVKFNHRLETIKVKKQELK